MVYFPLSRYIFKESIRFRNCKDRFEDGVASITCENEGN